MRKQPIIIATVFVAGLLFFSQTASAAYLKDRQRQQKQRIQHGIASGQITPREAKKLYQNQRHRIYRYKHNHRRVRPPRYDDSALRHFARR